MGYDGRTRGVVEVALGYILFNFFPLGIRSVDKVEIKAMVCGHKIKITHEVIFEMLQLPDKCLDIEWPSPT